MALLMIDGFDYIGTDPEVSMVDKGIWNGVSGSTYTRRTGRDGTGYSLELFSAGRIWSNVADQSGNTCILGFAFFNDDVTFGTDDDLAIIYRDTGGLNPQLSIDASGGFMRVRRGTTTLATGTTSLSLSTWYYVELKFLVHNSAGTYQLRLNGVDEIALASSQDTQNNGTDDSVQSIAINQDSGGPDTLYDDLYFMNTTGSINTDFLGDVQVKLLLPASDDTSAWTRSGGSVNAELVDDPEDDDGDTTYVHSATTTTQDWYDMPNGASNIDEVYGVQTSMIARKDDATTREVKTVIKAPTTTQDGADNALTTTYTGYTDMFETKDGSLAWDTTALDALLIGPNVVT